MNRSPSPPAILRWSTDAVPAGQRFACYEAALTQAMLPMRISCDDPLYLRAGFSDASHFARVVRARSGATPSQIRTRQPLAHDRWPDRTKRARFLTAPMTARHDDGGLDTLVEQTR